MRYMLAYRPIEFLLHDSREVPSVELTILFPK